MIIKMIIKINIKIKIQCYNNNLFIFLDKQYIGVK